MPKKWDKWMTDSDKWVQSHIYALEANTVNELWDQYQRALANMAIQLEVVASRYGGGETWSYADTNAQQRTQAIVDAIMTEMKSLTQSTSDLTIRRAMQSYYAGLYGRAWVTDTVMKGVADIPVLPGEAVRAAILAPYKGSTFVERFKGSDDIFQQKIRQSIVQSQIAGETMYQAQKRIAAELGLNISRRTKADRSAHRADFNRTQMIARTEMIRASNLGTLAFYERNKDTLKGWTWKATNDERTCPICGDLDGQNFTFDSGRLPPPEHPSCRCGSLAWFEKGEYNEFVKGNVPSFKEWATMKGIDKNVYGQTFDLKGKQPPKAREA